MLSRRSFLGLAGGVVLLAACGGDDDSDASSATTAAGQMHHDHGDEFSELGDFFNTVSQQLSADRMLLAGQKANLQSAVEHLEDAVALFDPSGQLLFSNPAMQPTLPAEAIGRALHGLLPDGHAYRTLVEETLATRLSRGPVQLKNPQRQDPAEDDLLVMTHAVAGTNGELVGVLLVARNLAHLTKVQSTLAYSRKLVALGRLEQLAHDRIARGADPRRHPADPLLLGAHRPTFA